MYEFLHANLCVVITTPTAHPPGQRHPSGRPPRRPSPPLQHRQPPQDDSPAAGSAAAAAGTSPAGTGHGQKPAPPSALEAGGLGRCLRMAVSGGAGGGPSPAAPAAGRRAYVPYGCGRRLRRAGPVAPAGLRWRLRQAGAGSVRRGLELGAEVGRRLRWNLAAL